MTAKVSKIILFCCLKMQVAHDEAPKGKNLTREQVYTKMEVITTVYITKGAVRSYRSVFIKKL